ncbi:hypothetical protein Hamer_G008006 [Homarus americanus]|uniref:Uncharacterized protein n=1 Tax=Homarus americanus TaxID=6706 RepID=A0A8J5JU29_HOMAM|nr:hypothetical protein Hamer_G008006 [Homarus americanus]
MGSMESTRSKTEVWLIGQHITEITGAQLPSRGDVLRLFFHGHNEHKKTVNDSASEVAASVISFWNKARIPTITEKSIGRKVVDLFLMWKGLKKNCTRTTDTQRKKEETFCDELEDLFDVAHPKAMQLLTIKEDRAFLAAQREKGRRGVMAGVDKKIACSIKRREESKSKQSLQQNQASSALEYDELGSSSETESQSSSSSSTSSLAISPVVSSSNRKRATLKVITPELSSTLDRTGISHRSALRIVSATAASLVQLIRNNLHKGSQHRGRCCFDHSSSYKSILANLDLYHSAKMPLIATENILRYSGIVVTVNMSGSTDIVAIVDTLGFSDAVATLTMLGFSCAVALDLLRSVDVVAIVDILGSSDTICLDNKTHYSHKDTLPSQPRHTLLTTRHSFNKDTLTLHNKTHSH